jgi:Xaa-Pro aminopeptidase
MTILRGKPTAKQREMVRLVEEAYGLAVSMLSPGVECGAVARAVDAFFAEHGWAMPHSLGHGIGLDVHEGPYLRSVSAEPTILEEGMVFTVEPGLYDPEAGGVRWENDFTIRGGEAVPLTRSRIRSIP